MNKEKKYEHYQIVYIYDLKARNKRSFNRTKRLFYYYLNKLPLKPEMWKTKSTLVVEPKLEKQFDSLFKQFKQEVIVYKLLTISIEQL